MRRARTRLAGWVLGLAVLTTLTRLPALLHPQAIDDEEVHSVVAREMVDGGRPYVSAVENKPPLLFWSYAAIFRVAGSYNWPALHAAALIWTLLTMAGLYFVGQQLFDPATGLITALLYSIFQSWAIWKNLAFSGELMMNLPIVWATALTFRPTRSRVRAELLVAGALACAAFLLKQPAAVAAVPLGIYLLLPAYRASRGLAVRHAILHSALLTLGFFGTLIGVVALLHSQGILGAAYYWIISNHDMPYFFWQRGVIHSLAFVGACAPLVLGAVLSLRDQELWDGKQGELVALTLLFAVSIIGTASGGRFYPHYYIQLVPPLALLAAPVYARRWSGDVVGTWLLRPSIAWGWLGVTMLAFLGSHTLGLARQRSVSEAGRYVRTHSAPDDRLFVWGQATQVYVDADRRPACRYIATDPLTGYIFGGDLPPMDTSDRIVPGAWANFERDLAAHPPGYIVDTEAGPGARYPVSRFPVLARLLADHYRPVYWAADGVIYRRNQGS